MTTKTKKADSKLSKDQQAKLDELTTVSDKIRYLTFIGWSRQQVATHLGKRYQHVRNVLVEDERLGKAYNF